MNPCRRDAAADSKASSAKLRFWQALAVASLLLGVFVPLGVRASPEKVIEADRIVLRQSGGSGIVLENTDGAPSIKFFDRDGALRMVLGCDIAPQGSTVVAAGLTVFDPHGGRRIWLANVPAVGGVASEDGQVADQIEALLYMYGRGSADTPQVHLGVTGAGRIPTLLLNSPESPATSTISDVHGNVVFRAP